MQRQVDGTVEADDLYHTAGQKGQAKRVEKSTWGAARGRRKKREPGETITIRIGPPSSPRSAAREV